MRRNTQNHAANRAYSVRQTEHQHPDRRLIAAAGIGVQGRVDAEDSAPYPAGDRVEQHHLPQHRVVGQPPADHAGVDEGDLSEGQAEQPEVHAAETECDPRAEPPGPCLVAGQRHLFRRRVHVILLLREMRWPPSLLKGPRHRASIPCSTGVDRKMNNVTHRPQGAS
jgi:hypothetical protein